MKPSLYLLIAQNDRRYLNFNGGELLNMADSGSIELRILTLTYLQLEGIMKATTSNHLKDT